jgi:hypothetical protein
MWAGVGRSILRGAPPKCRNGRPEDIPVSGEQSPGADSTRPACRIHGLADGVLRDDVDGLAPWGVRAGQLRVALMISRVQ